MQPPTDTRATATPPPDKEYGEIIAAGIKEDIDSRFEQQQRSTQAEKERRERWSEIHPAVTALGAGTILSVLVWFADPWGTPAPNLVTGPEPAQIRRSLKAPLAAVQPRTAEEAAGLAILENLIEQSYLSLEKGAVPLSDQALLGQIESQVTSVAGPDASEAMTRFRVLPDGGVVESTNP